MDILGIGPMELILILIVALAVFGPDKLPGIGAKLGRAMKDMRKATRAFSQEFDTARQSLEEPTKSVTEPFKEVAGLAKDVTELAVAVRNPSEAIRQSVMREMSRTDTDPHGEPPAENEPENRIAPPRLPVEPVGAPVELAEPSTVETAEPPVEPVTPATDAPDPDAEA